MPAATEIPMSTDESEGEPVLSQPSRMEAWMSRLKIGRGNFGMALLVASQLCNSIMITCCKLLVTDKDSKQFHPLQILFVRMAITYICCVAYMSITKSVPDAPFGKPEIRKWLFLRGIIGFTGVFGMYFSLLYLSLSDAVAITFLIPLVTAFLAFVLLRERYSLLEGVCSVVSLGGVVLIAKPNFIFGQGGDAEADDSVESSSTSKRLIATCVGLFGVLGASSVYIILRKIGNEAHPLISVGYFALSTVFVTTISIAVIPSVSFVLPQNLYQWTLFVVIGIAGFVYQFALTAGVQRVKASKASLVIYTQMVFAIGLDILIWHHFPEMLSVLGTIIIVGSTFVVMKFKPSEDEYEKPDDLERQHSLATYEDFDVEGSNKYNPQDVELQDFVIEDEEENKSPMNPEDELNSVKYSPAIKLNQE